MVIKQGSHQWDCWVPTSHWYPIFSQTHGAGIVTYEFFTGMKLKVVDDIWKAGHHNLKMFQVRSRLQESRWVQEGTPRYSSPPARWGLLDFIRAVVLLLLQFLLDHVCINFHLHFRLANSSPSSSPTSQLSAHCWTSTWDLPSSVRTAGPQPGTFPAQCAPLDLNLGPSQLSAHRWTSTWDLPSSVSTAGPQRPDRMPDRMPEDMPDKMP